MKKEDLLNKTGEEILTQLDSSKERGLSEKEASARIKEYGLNTLVQRNPFAFILQFLAMFFSPLIILLLVASVISAIAGESKDFFIIVSIVLVSGTVTFYQHYKSEHEAEKLKQKVLLNATVIREGRKREVPFSHVTIGDILLLSVGDIIPADAKLLECKELSVDESSLSGESFPAEKTVNVSHEHAPTKPQDTVYMGTHIVAGDATAIVTTIGKDTQFGTLSKEILVAKPQTSFDKDINEFVFLVIRFVLLLTISVFIINAVIHKEFLQSFLFALALAVGLAPELMPVILTINLSQGALRMEKKEVIVKYLPSIQNLGSMNILCTDKTGTITENKITLNDYQDNLGKENKDILLYGLLTSLYQAGFKNPLDESLLLHKEGISLDNFRKVDELPFDFERRALSVVVENIKEHKLLLITKGAPEELFLHMIATVTQGKIVKLSTESHNALKKRYQLLSSQGLRVIAVCYRDIEKKAAYSMSDEKNLIFMGFITFLDPIKKSVIGTLNKLHAQGISVKILTGDNEIVTKRICLEAGIVVDEIITGDDLRKMTEQTLVEKVISVNAFARLTPQQKAHIIEVLKKEGNVVGYLGDGINDAPPLKMADVGITVNNGSDIAKDVADIVLMRKSLAVLQEGVLLGRKTHANILKYILMEISSNFGNMLTVAGASFFLPFLPMLPVQILLNNFLYDISQISISSDNVDPDTIQLPGKWDKNFIKRFTLVFGPISSLFDFLTFFILLYILHSSPAAFRTGWFIESLVTQTLVIFLIRTNKIPFIKSKPSKLVVIGSFFVIIVGFLLTILPTASYFEFIRLPLIFFPLLAIIVFLYCVIVETTKAWFYRGIIER